MRTYIIDKINKLLVFIQSCVIGKFLLLVMDILLSD